ncbi:MAG: DUF6431 domain-containing protein, partial [bacterium]
MRNSYFLYESEVPLFANASETFLHLRFPPLTCFKCKQKDHIIKHGYYWRYVIDLNSERFTIPIQRFRCKNCNKTFSYLPPFLVRYRPYLLELFSPLITEYLTTSYSLSQLLYKKYCESPLSYRT